MTCGKERQASIWVFPISSPDLSSRSWRRRGGALELQRSRSGTAVQLRAQPDQLCDVHPLLARAWLHCESRRGGGGYIRITRVQVDRQTLPMHVINTIGDRLDSASARAITQNLVESEAISRELGQALLAATGERALRTASPESRDALRADIYKQVLIHSV